MTLPVEGDGEARTNLFGGSGTVRVWNVPLGRTPPFTFAVACRLDANGSVGRHQQETDAELIVGVTGEGRVMVGGEQHALRQGSVVPIPLGAILSIENETAEPLEYLILKARVG